MNDIFAYYDAYDEGKRLTQDKLHLSEYLVTMHLFEKYLGGGERLDILDCCAGCGVYAFALAEKGHRVTAGDIVPSHVNAMWAHESAAMLKEIYEGDATDMSRFENGSFDAVVCMGAMYNLLTKGDRNKAVSECLRVLKPGGLFVYAYETLCAMCLGQYLGAVWCTDSAGRIKKLQQIDDVKKTHIRNVFYGMTQDEVQAVARENGLQTLSNACTYGVFYPMFTAINDMGEDEYEEYVESLKETCEHEISVKYGMHGLYIGKKS